MSLIESIVLWVILVVSIFVCLGILSLRAKIDNLEGKIFQLSQEVEGIRNMGWRNNEGLEKNLEKIKLRLGVGVIYEDEP